MTNHSLFSKPSWQHFLHIDGLHALPMPALLAADEFFDWIQETGNVGPTPSDYAICAQSVSDGAPHAWLDQLQAALRVLIPSVTASLIAARALLPSAKTSGAETAFPDLPIMTPWDPCARIKVRKRRTVSVYPWELPDPWKSALRRAAQGLPGMAAAAPSPDIFMRLREKLCQCAWSAAQAGLPVKLNQAVVEYYLTELEIRLRARPHGIRWATMRATVEEMHRFARYSGQASDDDIRYLRTRLSRYEQYEKGQDALKFHALLETGNTTLIVLDKADALLELADLEESAVVRHRLRNAAAILGIFAIAPLRNADADLVFGETLVWEAGTWVIDTMIRKTRHHNPEDLIIPLEPEFARYVDIVLLGDFEPRYLPNLRAKSLQKRRSLIVHPNGSQPSETHIPWVFKSQTGNSFTTTRTMLHTDQAISRGEAGTRDAMAAAHQTSPKTAVKYQAKAVRQAAVRRVQDAAAARRASALPPELVRAIAALQLSNKERNDEDL